MRINVSLSQTAAQYIASTTLLDAGFSVLDVGRAMLTLEGRHDDEPTPEEVPSDPAEWPAWTDERWAPGPEPGYEPDPADLAWLDEQPSPNDPAEYEAWLDHLEHDYPREFPADGYLSDRDIITATGGAG
jgi:hypothetical protein